MIGRLLLAALAVLTAVTVLAAVRDARAHYRPGTHNVRHAVNLAWCGRSNRECYVGEQAWRVAGCETGGTYSVWARSPGGHLGLFQFGSYARATYGFGWNPWAQSFAARRMYRAEGWAPWTCATILGIQ